MIPTDTVTILLMMTVLLGSSWLSRGCPPPTLPNGDVRIKSQGRTVRFKCNRGFTRIGPKKATCLDSNRWSEKVPRCVGAGCPKFNLPHTVTVTELHDGGVLEFACAPGYTRSGPDRILCDGQGWNNEPPTCIEGAEPAPEACEFTQDLPILQSLCKEPNEALLQAETAKDHDKVCMEVIRMLKCVAANMTRCYDNFHTLNDFYFHSPYSCQFTQEHLMEIQKILLSKARPDPTPSPPLPTSDSKTPYPGRASDRDDDDTTSADTDEDGGDGGGATWEPGSHGGGDMTTSSSASPSNVVKNGSDGSDDKGYKVTGQGGNKKPGSSEEHTGSESKHPNSSTRLATHTVLVTITTIVSTIMASTT